MYAFFLLLFQDKLPLNPDGNPAQTPDLAFNTAISFLVNCDLQHYSGETGVTYFTQLFVLTFLQFVSAATGIAALVALFNGLKEKTTSNLGNFWVSVGKNHYPYIIAHFVSCEPLLLAFNGTPASYDGKDTIATLQGDSVQVSRGPAAGMIAIKHLGTNGGGWFGANSAHPLENPNYFTAMLRVDRADDHSYCNDLRHGLLYKPEKVCVCHFWCNDHRYVVPADSNYRCGNKG